MKMRLSLTTVAAVMLVVPVFADNYDGLLRLLKNYGTKLVPERKGTNDDLPQRGQLDSLFHINVCEHYWHVIECPKEYHVRIIDANFGRKDSTTCPGAHSDSRCYTPRTSQTLQSICYLKHSCTVYAWASILGDPCPEARKYLSVTYQCESFKGVKTMG